MTGKQKLLAYPEKRLAPRRDEKIITSWNGLAIKALTNAGKYLNHEEFIVSAQRAANFIQQNLFLDQRLLESIKMAVRVSWRIWMIMLL